MASEKMLQGNWAFRNVLFTGKSKNMTSPKSHYAITIILIIPVLFLAGCGVYSFTGASIPPEARTITVTYFVNNAQYVEPSLSQTLTDALRDRFLAQTDLDFINEGGDLQIDGIIADYSTKPIAIQGNETAAMNRLTVTVKVKYTNTLDPDKDYDLAFSRFEDYSSSQDLSAVKDELISLISEALVDDIFNKAVVNW
jgi:hypothetical protein